MPWVMLLLEDSELATQEVTFVNNIHVAGRTKEGTFDHTRDGCKQVKSRMNLLGNQADDRKFRQPSPTLGAWNGLTIHTNTPVRMKPTTGKKYDKFKTGLTWLTDCVKEGIKFVLTGDLRKIAGLGVNITEVYPTGHCYLKGFFNAVEAWRGDRDLEGWRLTDSMFEVGSLRAGDSPSDGEW